MTERERHINEINRELREAGLRDVAHWVVRRQMDFASFASVTHHDGRAYAHAQSLGTRPLMWRALQHAFRADIWEGRQTLEWRSAPRPAGRRIAFRDLLDK